MNYHGEGMAQDNMQAFVWFRKAAELGQVEAQYLLGLSNSAGVGGPQDLSKSYVWFSVAAANGYSGASERRDSTAEKLSQTQLPAAQKLAGHYFEKSQPDR